METKVTSFAVVTPTATYYSTRYSNAVAIFNDLTEEARLYGYTETGESILFQHKYSMYEV